MSLTTQGKVRKSVISWVLALCLAFSMTAPAFASTGAQDDEINLASLNDRVSGCDLYVEAINQLEAQVDALEAEIDDTAGQIDAAIKADIMAKIAIVEAQIAEIEALLAGLDAAASAGIAEVVALVEQIEAAWSEAVAAVLAVEAAAQNLNADLMAAAAQVIATAEAVEAQIQALSAFVAELPEAAYANLIAYLEKAGAAAADQAGIALGELVAMLEAELEGLAADAVSGESLVAGEYRYVAIGDAALDADESYAAMLGEYLGGLSEGVAVDAVELNVASLTCAEALEALQSEEAAARLAAADLVTLGLGNEELTVAAGAELVAILGAYLDALVAGEAYEGAHAADWASLVGEAGAAYVEEAMAEVYAELLAQVGDESLAAAAADIAEAYAFAYAGFSASYAEVVRAVKDLAPGAHVVLVGVANPFEGLSIPFGETEVDLGEYAGYVVAATDAQMLAHAIVDAGDVTFVAASQADSDIAAYVSDIAADVSALDFELIAQALEFVETGALPEGMDSAEMFEFFERIGALSDQIEALREKAQGVGEASLWMPNAEGQAYIYARILEAVDFALDGAGEPASIEGASVESAGKAFVYDSDYKTPELTVTLDGAVLAEGVDYEVAYVGDSNLEVGSADAVITGVGDYSGELLVEGVFEITHVAEWPFDDFDAARDWYLKDYAAFSYGNPGGAATLYIEYVTQTGLMVGMDADTFGDRSNVTRAQVVRILYALAGEPEASSAAPFSDVPSSKWYAEEVAWAYESGIASGYADGTFKPDQPVSRQELACFFERYCTALGAGEPAGEALGGMRDGDEVKSWARESVEWCIANLVLVGDAGGYVKPQANATRAETAKMLAVVGHDVLDMPAGVDGE